MIEVLSYVIEQQKTNENINSSSIQVTGFQYPDTRLNEYDISSLLNIKTKTKSLVISKDGANYQFNVHDEDDLIKSVSVRDMVEKIKNVFGLNNVQVADIVGVSRPSLYNHISEKENPKGISRYNDIFEVAVDIDKQVSGQTLKYGLKSILVDGKTLLSYLKSPDTKKEDIVRVSLDVAKKIELQRKTSVSKSEQKINSRMYSVIG